MWVIGLHIETVTQNVKDIIKKIALYTSNGRIQFGILNIKRFVIHWLLYFKYLFLLQYFWKVRKNKNQFLLFASFHVPENIYLFKVYDRNTKKGANYVRNQQKAPEQYHWYRSGIFSVDFEHISHLF